MGVFATAPRHQPLFPTPTTTSATPTLAVAGGSAAGLGRFATSTGVAGAGSSTSSVGALARSMLSQAPPVLQPQQQQQQAGVGATAAAAQGLTTNASGGGSMSAVSSASSLSSAAAAAAAGPGVVGNGKAEEAIQEHQPWVSVGGAWRDEENVCGYWRFSEGAGVVGGLEAGKQVRRGIGQRKGFIVLHACVCASRSRWAAGRRRRRKQRGWGVGARWRWRSSSVGPAFVLYFIGNRENRTCVRYTKCLSKPCQEPMFAHADLTCPPGQNQFAGGDQRPEQVRLVGRGARAGAHLCGHVVSGGPRRQGEGGRGRRRVLPGEGKGRAATAAASARFAFDSGVFCLLRFLSKSTEELPHTRRELCGELKKQVSFH